jgi:hypothetical protein
LPCLKKLSRVQALQLKRLTGPSMCVNNRGVVGPSCSVCWLATWQLPDELAEVPPKALCQKPNSTAQYLRATQHLLHRVQWAGQLPDCPGACVQTERNVDDACPNRVCKAGRRITVLHGCPGARGRKGTVMVVHTWFCTLLSFGSWPSTSKGVTGVGLLIVTGRAEDV